MLGGRRSISRSRGLRYLLQNQSNFHGGVMHHDALKSSPEPADTGGPRVLSPKHVPIPNIPRERELWFQTIELFFSSIVCFLQYLHLYRSVWWLPQSYTVYAMNVYLIDPYLVGFIVTILTRRFIYSLIISTAQFWTPSSFFPVVQQIVRLLMLGMVIGCLLYCTYFLMKAHSILQVFCLYYPMVVYFAFFGLSVAPFFDVMAAPTPSKGQKEGNSILSFDGSPVHNCSVSPESIRQEVETFKIDFNNRMKQVLFSSLFSAYYGGFLPCCFAQPVLYYDVYWATQHLVFIWLGSFLMHIVHCYPVRYCDVLHRAALHLGRWCKMDTRNLIPTQLWSESILWPQGAIIRHCKEIFKAEGVCNAAIPGNTSHSRFYGMFYNPSGLICGILGLQLSLVVLQGLILLRSSEWYQLVSMSLLLFSNYHTLFKLVRNYFVCWRVYRAEQVIQNKNSLLKAAQ